MLHIDNDLGRQANVFGLTDAQLAQRRVVHLNIAEDIHLDKSERNDPSIAVRR
jgi:hypothetical protein